MKRGIVSMVWKWYNSEIIQIKDETPSVKRFWLKIEGDEIFQFLPGQFVTLDLPISEKRTKRWRSYSIANAPDETNVLELCIVRLEGGEGTRYLFEEAKVGSPIRFKGPSGNFVLPDPLPDRLVLICTGTGVAPFRAMLQSLPKAIFAKHEIHLIFGCRRQEDILYQKEFEELAAKNDNFSYSIATSREEYNGYRGYVHNVYMSAYHKFSTGVKFYLCGWSAMIDEAVENLILKMGCDRKQVLYELYD